MKVTTLFNYVVARETELPPIQAALEYVLAGNGLFARGARAGLEVLMPLAPCTVKGLSPLEPYLKLAHSRVPAFLLTGMLVEARLAADADANPVEVAFHLNYVGARWRLDVPPQDQGCTHVRPLGPALGSSYARALVEAHSHHALPAFFSDADDADETGFRVYAVLGHIFSKPELRVRVGLYGYHWLIPAGWVFELPATARGGCVMQPHVLDCYPEKE